MNKLWLIIIAVLMTSTLAGAGIRYQGWGPRFGMSSDPDQLDLGVHLNMGEFVPRLRFQPNLEIGFGDEITTVMLNAETFYLFAVSGSTVKPYAGGELTFMYWKADHKFGSVDDFEMGISPVGGLEYQFNPKLGGFVELKIGFGDIPDLRVTLGLQL
ncbi:MAG: hypothetical protein NTW14_02480 [bacterium]|nr:hypothetical protein [bacterium]